MAKHIHIHLPARRTRDAGTAHDPKNGQFTAGSNGGSGTVVKHQPSGTTVPHQAKKTNPLHDRPDNKPGKQPSDGEMKKHPNYNEEDHQYLKGKGWTNSEIHQRWTAEHGNGQGPATGKVKAPDVTGVVGNPNFYKKKSSPQSKGWQGKPPHSFEHEGSKYHHTGKTGTHNASGTATAEYEEHDKDGKATGNRAWLRSTGHVDKD